MVAENTSNNSNIDTTVGTPTPAPPIVPTAPTSTIRLKAKLNKDGITEIKALITHPMETGLRRDPATGVPIPTHFIQEVTGEHQGKIILTTLWNSGISKDPYLSFKFKGGKVNDKVKLSWKDNFGKSDSVEVAIEAEEPEEKVLIQ